MINVISPINQLGYGIAGLNIVKALSKITDVSLWTIGPIEISNPQDADTILKLIRVSKKPDFKAPCIRIWHQDDMSQFVGTGTKIGFPIFELDTFSDVERHHLSSLDKIFVCSKWAKEIILSNISINEDCVFVVPLGVDRTIFDSKENNDPKNNTVFFNCGKWEIRKGHDVLVDIFNDAFSPTDNVELWLMCENPFLQADETKQWHSLYKESNMGSKIKFLPRLSSQQEVYSIMSKVDCGIFPSRAEGWNLELLELMSCGKSVISTDYSAHTEFCTKNNAYLVDIKEKELAKDGKWFFGQGNWAKLTYKELDSFVDYMREVHKLKQCGQLKTNYNGVETAKQFSWNNTAEAILKHV